MATDTELTLLDYLALLKRRSLVIVVTFVLVFGAAILVALFLPPTYQSTGTILVESQQISEDLIPTASSSYADERVAVIRQRVMTRENLLKIVDKYHLFSSATRPLSVSEKTDIMREHIGVDLLSAKGGRGQRGQSTIAFTVAYDDASPIVAYRVANDLVTLFLDENVKVRTARATETTEFLTQEADRLKHELETIEDHIATYKQEHGNALPEHLDLHMTMLARADSDLQETERDLKAAEEERSFLDLELANARKGAVVDGAGVALTPAQQLARLEAQLAQLRAIYTDAHPDVRAVRRQIAELKAQSGTHAGNGDATLISPDVQRVQAKIAAANSRIASLQAQTAELRRQITGYQNDIQQTPQTERGLITLQRDHDNAQKKYDEIRAKQMNARIAETLEQENKAERFSLLEPPLMPDKPIKPNRKKILVLGFAGAIAAAIGLALLLEQLRPRVRGARALGDILGQQPLVSIPYITTSNEQVARRRMLRLSAIGMVAAVLVMLLLAHLFYMPLDLLILKVLSKIT